MVCSESCALALAQSDELLAQVSNMTKQLLRQGARSAKASAVYCFLGGGLSATAAVVAWFILPSTFLIFFTGACAVVLLLSGIYYVKASGKEST